MRTAQIESIRAFSSSHARAPRDRQFDGREPLPWELRRGDHELLCAAIFSAFGCALALALCGEFTFPELLAALATRLPADIPEQVWFDDALPPTRCEPLAAWCRLAPAAIAMLDVSRLYPLAGTDVWTIEPETWWHASPLTLEPSLRLPSVRTVAASNVTAASPSTFRPSGPSRG